VNLWLIPALPAAAVVLNLLLAPWLGKRGTALLGCGSVGASLVVAINAVLRLAALPPEARTVVETAFTWMRVGDLTVPVAFQLDPLSAVMILVVTGVGFLIHLYSIGYMAHDPGFRRFFLYMNLFTFSMLTLVMADNFLLMFVGWEGVGLCSYLLIGFWYERPSAAEAGKKAFIVNRIGDFGFLLGMILLFVETGSLRFEEVFAAAPHLFGVGAGVITVATLLLFLGATGKSAQIPLYTWLPDAMEGPTPVSALIHAATMVTAGVYMVARCHVLYQLAPIALETVAVIGAATALYAATIGVAQNDIKRVLAYSTVSQLGYMFFACGVGAFASGIFHLMTHAFFKALLFLAAGSVIHGLSGEQDLRRMGGLAPRLPWTHATMLVATLTIAGFPPLSAFFSKDEILGSAFASGHYGVWAAGLLAALLTSFYMFRLYYLAFRGPSRLTPEAEHHVHESPFSMVGPLVVLAVLSAVGGFVGLPFQEGGHAFARWMAPVFAPTAEAVAQGGAHAAGHHLAAGVEWALLALAVLIAAAGWLFASRAYGAGLERAEQFQARVAGVWRVLQNKYWVDELYDALVVRPVKATSDRMWLFWDNKIVDGAVNGVGYLMAGVSALLRLFQTGFVGTYALFISLGVAALLLHFLRPHP
jgi:NADH-quinone oxidoreductase subunit L